MLPSTNADAPRFRRLYERHYQRVLAYALRRASPADAHDAVAETFLVAWRRLASCPAPADALPWLLGIARRVLANQRRTERRARRLSARLAAEPHEESDAPDVSSVLGALARLRQVDREVLLLHAWDGLSHREIAAAFACSENAAAIRLHRARARLSEELGKVSRQPDMSGHGRP